MAFRQLFPKVVQSPGSSSSFLVPRPHSGFAWGPRFREGCRRGVLFSAAHPRGWLMSWHALSRQIYLLKKLKTPC